jgi:putative CocE/NonD family hydrolase
MLAALLFALAAAALDAVQFEENLMIPMRDGVRLATDIYRPAQGGAPLEEKLPVLLQRTPYGKTGSSLVESARFFAAHGYVVALQDVRGTYASEGEFTKYIGEGQDGYDTIEYLAKLPYTNGKVGMWGTSYAAHVQANAAKLAPAPLAMMILNMGGMSNGWDHKVRNHGAFELQQLTWAFRQLAEETEDALVKEHLAGAPIESWLLALPFRRGLNPLSIAPNFEDYILEMATHGDYDDDYWKHRDVNWQEHYDETLDIPMVHLSGWYDSYAGGTIQNYVELSKRKRSPISLVMGPWTHGGNTRSYAGDVEFGAAAAIADFPRERHLRWFDRFLKGAPAPGEPNVRLFVMGTGDGHRDAKGRLFHGGQWIEASGWPLPGTKWVRYYFHEDGSLSERPPAEAESATTYTFDPQDPVPTIGGAFSSTAPLFEPGAYHQAERQQIFGSKPPYLPLSARPDVVVFQTEPLVADVVVVGPIEVELHASSTAPDTDFTAKLVDVYPPSVDFPSGFEMNVTDGILRARYRNGPARQELMTPGEVYRFRIEPFPTANVFKKGHRIRIDVSSSNFPRFDVNPNTGEPLGRNRRVKSADNRLYHDAAHPSHVVLPIQEGKWLSPGDRF